MVYFEFNSTSNPAGGVVPKYDIQGLQIEKRNYIAVS